MSKYIDADCLRTEIESLIEKYSSIKAKGVLQEGYKGGRLIGYEDALHKLDSLQQDETQVDKMLCSQVWWEEQGWIMIPPDATIEGIDSLLNQVRKKIQQEQLEIDLDEEIYFWIEGGGLIYPMSNKEKNNIKDTALHFYELGYNARK